MNGQTEGQVRRIQAMGIRDRLAEVEKLSACVLDTSCAIHDFFLGESPKTPKPDSAPRENAGYFCQVKNDIDDVYAFLEETMDRLLELSKEIGIDRMKLSERPERRV